MGHDFVSADIQVLGFIEHRIENNLLRAGADQL
jgi:hypothetical protein